MQADTPCLEFLKRISSPSQLLSLFDLLPDVSFFMKDRKGRFIALNRSGCEYCGVKFSHEAFGKTDRDFFPRARAAEYMADDRSVMKSGRPILNRLEAAPEMEGSPRLVVTNKIPLRDSNGHVIGVAGFSRRVEQVRCAPAAMKKLASAVDHIHRKHAEPITTEELARRAGLSLRQFERTFRKALGTSPRQYILRVRIESACSLLAETDDTIASIAQKCGFYDHAHFTHAFISQINMSPSQFRREHQMPSV